MEDRVTIASNVSTIATTLQDVAALARKLAERDPYRSASGPEALLALATHLDEMIASNDGGRRNVVQVEVRKKKSGTG